MVTVLVTGSSGFVGSALVDRLTVDHRVLSMSRSPIAGAGVAVAGDFADPAALDGIAEPVDVLVHLAGVTGSAGEEEAMTVNVTGTRRLLRWAVDRGIRRAVVASSIAAAGCLAPDFSPRSLPVDDDHPCDSSNVYGVSKWMIEQLGDYFHRVEHDLEVVMLRLGVVLPDDADPVTIDDVDRIAWPFCDLGAIARADAVDAFATAVVTPLGPGVHRMNLVAPQPRTPLPTAATIRRLLGPRADGLDLAVFGGSHPADAGVYDVARIARAYGFVARTDVRTMIRRTA